MAEDKTLQSYQTKAALIASVELYFSHFICKNAHHTCICIKSKMFKR